MEYLQDYDANALGLPLTGENAFTDGNEDERLFKSILKGKGDRIANLVK